MSEIIVADLFTEDEYKTAYAVRTACNKALKEIGIEKVLPGPMFYTYLKKGYIKGLDKASVVEWFEGYVTKLVSKVETVQVNEIEEDLNEAFEELDAQEA